MLSYIIYLKNVFFKEFTVRLIIKQIFMENIGQFIQLTKIKMKFRVY